MDEPDFAQLASDIMDEACLGEHWVNNGVDAALRKSIAAALQDAYGFGLRDAADRIDTRFKLKPRKTPKIRAIGRA